MFNAPVRRDRRRSTAAFLLTLLVNGAVIAALSSVHDAPAAAAIPDEPMERYYPVMMPKPEPRGGSAGAKAPRPTAKTPATAVAQPEPIAPPIVTPLLPEAAPVALDATLSLPPGDSPPDGGGGGGKGPGKTPGPGEGLGQGDGDGDGDGLRVVDYDAVRVRSQVSPEFPQAARALNLSGDTCLVRLDIDTRGRPTSAVASGCSEIFADAAEEAALKWRFAPLFMDGHPIPARFSISFRFRYD